MGFLFSLADARDIVVIIYGIAGIVLFFISIAFVIALYWGFRRLQRVVKELLDDSVKPTLASVRETAQSIKGTTDFVGEKAVSPIIRGYGMVSGAKRGLGVLSGLARRSKE